MILELFSLEDNVKFVKGTLPIAAIYQTHNYMLHHTLDPTEARNALKQGPREAVKGHPFAERCLGD